MIHRMPLCAQRSANHNSPLTLTPDPTSSIRTTDTAMNRLVNRSDTAIRAVVNVGLLSVLLISNMGLSVRCALSRSSTSSPLSLHVSLYGCQQHLGSASTLAPQPDQSHHVLPPPPHSEPLSRITSPAVERGGLVVDRVPSQLQRRRAATGRHGGWKAFGN